MDTNNYKLLTAQEYNDVFTLFCECDYAEKDDLQLHESGNHRALYGCLDYLGLKPYPGRGPVFHLAADLLKFNSDFWKGVIIELINETGGEAVEYAKLFLGLHKTKETP